MTAHLHPYGRGTTFCMTLGVSIAAWVCLSPRHKGRVEGGLLGVKACFRHMRRPLGMYFCDVIICLWFVPRHLLGCLCCVGKTVSQGLVT